MFRITAHSISQVRANLEGEGVALLDELLQRHRVAPAESEVSERPWVQLTYHEIAQEELDAVLSFAGITAAGSPVGLPCHLEPRLIGGDTLLFSTQELRAFVTQRFSGLLERRAKAATLQDSLDSHDVSAQEYLACGVVECTIWCETRGHALVIAW